MLRAFFFAFFAWAVVVLSVNAQTGTTDQWTKARVERTIESVEACWSLLVVILFFQVIRFGWIVAEKFFTKGGVSSLGKRL